MSSWLQRGGGGSKDLRELSQRRYIPKRVLFFWRAEPGRASAIFRPGWPSWFCFGYLSLTVVSLNCSPLTSKPIKRMEPCLEVNTDSCLCYQYFCLVGPGVGRGGGRPGPQGIAWLPQESDHLIWTSQQSSFIWTTQIVKAPTTGNRVSFLQWAECNMTHAVPSDGGDWQTKMSNWTNGSVWLWWGYTQQCQRDK